MAERKPETEPQNPPQIAACDTQVLMWAFPERAFGIVTPSLVRSWVE